jgi:hypothetical protein
VEFQDRTIASGSYTPLGMCMLIVELGSGGSYVSVRVQKGAARSFSSVSGLNCCAIPTVDPGRVEPFSCFVESPARNAMLNTVAAKPSHVERVRLQAATTYLCRGELCPDVIPLMTIPAATCTRCCSITWEMQAG